MNIKKQTFSDFTKKQLIIYLTSVLLIVTLVFMISIYFLVDNQIKKELKNKNHVITEFLDYELRDIEQQVSKVESNYGLSTHSQNETKEELYKIRTESKVKFNFTLIQEDQVVMSNLYDKNLAVFLESTNLSNGIYFLNKKDDQSYIEANRTEYTKEQNADVFAITEFKKGYLILEILHDSLNTLNKSNSSSLIISDEFDNILFQDSIGYQDQIGKVSIKPKDYIFFSETIQLFGYPINITSIKDISLNQQILMIGYILIFIIFIFLAAIVPFLSRKIATSVSVPLNDLLDVIETNKQGELDYSATAGSFYEFDLLVERYNELLNSVQNLIESKDELAERKRWMEIKLLQDQFNPHFLYNTLESIRYEILLDQKNASKMIVSLSKLMRYSINYGENTVVLSEDIEYVKDYLDLQKMRFKDRLNYTIDLDKGLLNIKVPKLLVQPLVENSIKYNMDDVNTLLINIKGISYESKYILVVSDNGIGINNSELQELNAKLYNNDYVKDNYGLFNVHRSLQLLYGAEYGIEISNKDSGLTIYIYLPKNKECMDV